ncbi:MAG: TPM domain-containing protein [Bacteroidales bacterium]|jgi:uncharacterized protein|nr:TPM domain-containing protein [Bacteroidales bacterium]
MKNIFFHTYLYKQRLWGIVFFLSIFSHTIAQNDILDRPNPPCLVNDFANIFTSQQKSSLERKLVAYNDSTSTQIAVITINSLNGYDINDFSDRLGEKWGVGHKGKDNGVIILIKPKLNERDYGEVNISIGYGLEDVIPDVIAKRIVSYEMIPKFKEEDYYGGVSAAINVIFDLASGKYSADFYTNSIDSEEFWITIIVLGVIFAVVFILIMPRKGGRNGGVSSGGSPPYIFFGSSRGSGGGSFGGFGGGSFGGGGASGRW